MTMKIIPKKTIARVLLYLRILGELTRDGKKHVSSKELAAIAGLSDVQIRKDISRFGKIGRPRIGYQVRELKKKLEEFVLGQKAVHVALFGVGNLGAALLKFPGFHSDRIKVVAAYDVDASKIGKTINGVPIYALEDAAKTVKRIRTDIGVIAVPEAVCQSVADTMIRAGLKRIINFAPASINVPKGVAVKDIDFTIEFLSLFCDSREAVPGTRGRGL